MPEEFDADAAAKLLHEHVQQVGETVRSLLPLATPEPLFRQDHAGNLVTRAGVLIRKKLEPLKLGKK